jgi:hypothetical protein
MGAENAGVPPDLKYRFNALGEPMAAHRLTRFCAGCGIALAVMLR